MPGADLRDCSSTGEPGALKGACPVRGGAVGKGPVQVGTSLAAYSTNTLRAVAPESIQRCRAEWPASQPAEAGFAAAGP